MHGDLLEQEWGAALSNLPNGLRRLPSSRYGRNSKRQPADGSSYFNRFRDETIVAASIAQSDAIRQLKS